MGNFTIDQKYITPFIKNGKFSIIDTVSCNEFNDYISENYPWNQYSKDRIDWDLVNGYKQLEWLDASVLETKEFIKKTCLSKYEKFGIVYSAFEPGIIGDSEDIIDNLEQLSAHTPWVLFIVGVTIDKYGIYKLHNADFIELWRLEQIMTASN